MSQNQSSLRTNNKTFVVLLKVCTSTMYCVRPHFPDCFFLGGGDRGGHRILLNSGIIGITITTHQYTHDKMFSLPAVKREFLFLPFANSSDIVDYLPVSPFEFSPQTLP